MLEARVENGDLVQDEEQEIFASLFVRSGLDSDVRAIEMTRTDGCVDIRIDEKYSKEKARLENYKAMKLFGRNVSRNAGSRFLPVEMRREFAVMLYLDEYDKAYLYPLLPRELNDTDSILLAMLANVVEQQPMGLFSKYLSVRGRFSCCVPKGKLVAWTMVFRGL